LQRQPPGEVVTNDITCGPADPVVVEVEDRGRLDLAGYTLSGGVMGVRCLGRCTVTSSAGPGTIRDAVAGLNALSRARPSNLSLVDNETGILGDFDRTRLRGEQVTITGGFGIQAKTVRFTGLTVTAAFPAIQAQRVRLDGASITGCDGSAIRASRVRLENSTLTGNTPVDLETLTVHAS
jgi:hypothetical protein